MAYEAGEFGHRLMVARKDARMTQEELGKAVGSDANSITRYETGNTTPGLDRAYALAVALGVTLDELTGMRKEAS